MTALPLGRWVAQTLLGHRLSQLCGGRGKAAGNVHLFQWVIFHQLQMALWKTNKQTKKAGGFQWLANYPQYPEMNELSVYTRSKACGSTSGKSPASSLLSNRLRPDSHRPVVSRTAQRPHALGAPCTVMSEAGPWLRSSTHSRSPYKAAVRTWPTVDAWQILIKI